MKIVITFLLAISCLIGQDNFAAIGMSYNPGASPNVAGTGLYARKLVNGTEAFTVVDALPTTVKPFTVSTQVGVGIAQKIVTINKIEVWIPTSAGVAITGDNTGWNWSTGGMVVVRVKGWNICPNVRMLKASVGGGYYVIPGLMVGKEW